MSDSDIDEDWDGDDDWDFRWISRDERGKYIIWRELFDAADNGDLDTIKRVVRRHSLDINVAKNCRGRPFFAYACSRSSFEVLHYLVDTLGADVNAYDEIDVIDNDARLLLSDNN